MKKLMLQKPLDKIRVTEICREAEIERPTFYYHFRDKYDLVAWIFTRNAFETDVLSASSAAKSMNRMRQDYLFYKRAYEDNITPAETIVEMMFYSMPEGLQRIFFPTKKRLSEGAR